MNGEQKQGAAPAASPSAGRARPAPGAELTLDDRTFAYLAGLVHRRTGILLRPEKRGMLRGRLAKRLRVLGVPDFRHYCALLEGEHGETEIAEMVNAVTTNLTDFFRERHHFDDLAEHTLPAITRTLTEQRSNRLRLWSAGCSSGQEPYSIAMVLAACLPDRARWDARILAPDIDTTMIARAQAGIYPAAQATGIPETYRRRFTYRTETGVAMSPELRDLIVFKPLNLMDAWPMRGPFDVIFCRNVVIYFDKPTQAELFDRFADILAPHGRLYIGHSENLFKVTDRFRVVATTTYQKVRCLHDPFPRPTTPARPG